MAANAQPRQAGGPAIQFKKAVKKDARGRVALVGPAGSGKSFTMLKLARELAGPNGKIAAIDTEHGSLSKYADIFEFDVFELESYSPTNFMSALEAAELASYDVFCCDSLSHFWVGKDGALEFVDMAAKRHKDNMGGWKDFRPHERAMVDAMIASPCHVIVTMRTKTEYVEEVNPSNGKKMRKKVGLQPVQRDGLEYEFDMVGYMDDNNDLIVDKTRCSSYNGKVLTRPSGKDFTPFKEWLKGALPINQPRQQPPAAKPAPAAQQKAKTDQAQPVEQPAAEAAETQPAAPRQASGPVLPQVQALVDLLNDASTGGVKYRDDKLAELYKDLTEVLAETEAVAAWENALRAAGVTKPADLNSSKKVRIALKSLWMANPSNAALVGAQS